MSDALHPQFTLKSYKIQEVLEEGSVAIVYLATDTTLGQKVVIKEYLPKDYAQRQETLVVAKSQDKEKDYLWGLERFYKEAQTLAKFRHPNIVRISRFFKAYNTAYMVTDYEEGKSLEILLDGHKNLLEEQINQILYPLLNALETIHSHNVLHRDIKPSNIIIRPDKSPVLIDFGAARQVITGMSRPLTSIVSPGFAPPEQYDNTSKQGPWTDFYGLGAVLYQCISGRRPMESTRRLLDDHLMPAKQIAKGNYSEELLKIIDLCLHVKPENRPKDVKALKKHLTTEQETILKKYKPDTPVVISSNNSLIIILVITLITLLGIIFLLISKL